MTLIAVLVAGIASGQAPVQAPTHHATTLGAQVAQTVPVAQVGTVGSPVSCETEWLENAGYPTADGPWERHCGNADGVDVTPALNTCDERAELMYAIAESAGSIGDAAWEDVQAECSGRAW